MAAFGARFAWFGALFILVTTSPGAAQDTDGDGVPDAIDNCITIAGGAIPQCDTDGDGYGNVCDPDFDQNFATNANDFSMYFVPSFQTGEAHPSGTDLDCNGTVNANDFSVYFVPKFKGVGGSSAPGPSGLACAGTRPCLDTDQDGIPNHQDSCILVKNAGPYACDPDGDTDGDGYGNACDADYDQNGSVTAPEMQIWSQDFQTGEDRGVGTDHDCNGIVNANDNDERMAQFGQGFPGPSGLNPVPPAPNADTDHDGRLNSEEDTDGDGFWDPGETHLNDVDTDNDGLCDGKARQAWDAVGTETCAGSEYWEGTSPLLPDSDGDQIGDQEEALAQIGCANCFAVVVVPDTQHYPLTQIAHPTTNAAKNLNQTMQYICENKDAWWEPSTKKRMPIRMVAHLGDLIANYTTSDPTQEWQLLDAAFDILDGCGVPYVVVPGNHDSDTINFAPSLVNYSKYFAAPCTGGACTTAPFDTATVRSGWASHRCFNPYDCQWPNEWFAGVGDDVEANTYGAGMPASDQPGRHRAAVIRAPNAQRFVFIGLDYRSGMGPEPWRDDLTWVEGLMNAYPTAPTVLLHHDYFHDGGGGTIPGGTPWNRLVVNHPQVFMTLTGHYGGGNDQWVARHQTTPNDVLRLFRNFQNLLLGQPYPGLSGNGWQVVLVFDPDAGEIRARSYRISDIEQYQTQWMYDNLGLAALPPGFTVNRSHTGTLQETWLLDTDWGCPEALKQAAISHTEACEQSVSWDFQ